MIPEFKNSSFPACVVDQFDPDLVLESCEWIRQYCDWDGGGSLLRFAIGLYQIGQAVRWGPEAGMESVGAACIHLIGAAELCEIPMHQHLPHRFSECQGRFDASDVLSSLTRAQQQHVYIVRCTPGTIRAKRIDRRVLGQETAHLVTACMSLVASRFRGEGIGQAMEMLASTGWKTRK